MRRVIAVLAMCGSLTVFAPACFAAQGDGYPTTGKALEQLTPAADYTPALQGRSLALGILRSRAQGFVPSPQLHDYVKGVLVRLLQGVNLPPTFKPEVRILAAPEFAGECTPDGTLVVTVGLLEQIENEDELAFVIGHEVAHAIYRHEAKNWAKKSQYYAVVNGTSRDAVAQSAYIAASATPYLGSVINLARHLEKLSDNVLMPQMERGQEDAADALGFDLMIRAGYDPEASLAVMDKLAQQEAEASRAATEAKAAQKQNSAEATANGMNIGMGVLGVVISGGTSPLAWANLAVAAFGAAVDGMAEDATSHHPATERANLLSAYAYREYRNIVFVDPKPVPWSPVSTSPLKPQLVALMSHYTMAEDAAAYVADRTQGTDVGARFSVAASTGMPTANHAYTEFVAAEYYQLGRQNALFEAALLKAASGPEPSWEVYSRLVDIYLGRHDYVKAQALMDEAVRRFDNSPVLLPKRIEVLRASGRQADVVALVPQCERYDIPELTDICRRAAGKT
jgi:Zn-dependent protease with chaperone function